MTGLLPDKDDLNRKKNILDTAQTFIDSHIRLVQTKVFTKVEDIPKHFITSHVRLLGKVTSIGEFGVLKIQHIPTVKVRLPFKAETPVESLPVHLGCVNVGPYGRKWLIDNVYNKKVWFKPLYVDKLEDRSHLYTAIELPKVSVSYRKWLIDNVYNKKVWFKPLYVDKLEDRSHLYSAIELPKILRNTKVNEELIKQGLSRVTSPKTDYSLFSEDKFLLKFLDRLVHFENVASQKKIGLWGGPLLSVEEERKWLKSTFNVFKSILSSPYYVLKWIYKRIKK